MAPSLEEQLAKVNGVVIPSKLPEGQKQVKALKTRPQGDDAKSDRPRDKTCPICGHTARRPREIQAHFVVCVKTNGNPTGARWDDNLSLGPRSHLVKRKRNDLDESANADTPSASKRTARAPTTTEQRDERQRRFYERLAAVDGVVIPSKLAPGELPERRHYEASGSRQRQCPICGEFYGRKTHVESHFASCVETNGNPTGARWDEAWNGAAFRADGVSGQVSTEPQDYQMQDLQPEDYELAAPQFDGSVMAKIPLDAYRLSEPQPESSRPNGFEPYDPFLDFLGPQLRPFNPPHGNLYQWSTAPNGQGMAGRHLRWGGGLCYAPSSNPIDPKRAGISRHA